MYAFALAGELVRDYALRSLRARRRALLARGRTDALSAAELTRINGALRRLELGTWGHCDLCAGSIEVEALLARPETERCDRCT